MRLFCKLTFALGCLLLIAVSLPLEVRGQIVLGPRFGVRFGPHSFGAHTETTFSLQEVPITTGNSGRIDAIAINPAPAAGGLEILVTSESGGLFKSTDGGVNWTHIDEVSPPDTRDVAYLPSDPRVAFVTAADDFRTPSGAGVWRSDLRGHWQQSSISIPTGARCSSRVSAYGIAIQPDPEKIYVGTSCGILVSADRGDTWLLKDTPGPGREGEWRLAAFYSVVALGAGRVIAAGQSGVWYSEDAGETWARSIFPTGVEGLYDEGGIHALSSSPVSPDHAYVVTGRPEEFKLFYSMNAGQRWDLIPSPAGKLGAGGHPFVKVGLVPGTRDIDLYFSDGTDLHKRRATRRAGPTPSFDYETDSCFAAPDCFIPTVCQDGWRVFFLAEDRNHTDVRDVVLQDGFQLLLANDGGLEKWRPDERCPRFSSLGGGRGGLNAWQLNSVTGQRIEHPLAQHIYIGSHDNRMLATPDYGVSWREGGCEGSTIQLDREVESIGDSVVTWTLAGSGGCQGRLIGGALFQVRSEWPDLIWPGPRDDAGLPIPMNGDPILLKRGVYMQAGRYMEGMYEEWLTKTFGASWELPLSLRYLPADEFSIAGPSDNPVLYQPTLRPIDSARNQIFWFTKLSGVLTDPFRSASVSEPLMQTADGHFGSLGLNQTWEHYYNCPFAVDPGNPDHLIAPDAIKRVMRQSIDGGNNWTEMPALTDLVTYRGAFRFSKPIGLSDSSDPSGLLGTLVSEISFCPDHPEFVLIGTQESGLYYSDDRGEDGSWIRIPNSDHIKPVSGFYWESPTSVYVSTHGRGLWHLGITARAFGRGDLELVEWCPIPCFLDLRAGPEPDRRPYDIDEAVLVTDGAIIDAVIENGLLKSFAITPGAMAISLVSKQTTRKNLLPTYADRTGQFVGMPGASELIRQGKVIRGLTFKNGLVKHLVYGDTIVTLEPSPRKASKIKPPKTLPVDNRPYLSIVGQEMSGGVPVLHGPGELQVFGRNFAKGRNTPIEIRTDDKIVAQGVIADQQGRFAVTIRSPSGMGWHRIQISQRLANGKQLQDARLFFIRPLDR